MVLIPDYKLEEFGKKGDLDLLKNFIVAKLTIEFKNKFPQKKDESALSYNRRKTTYVKKDLDKIFQKYADKVRFRYMKAKSFKSF